MPLCAWLAALALSPLPPFHSTRLATTSRLQAPPTSFFVRDVTSRTCTFVMIGQTSSRKQQQQQQQPEPAKARRSRSTPPLAIHELARSIGATADPAPLLLAASSGRSLGGKTYYLLLKALRKRGSWAGCYKTVLWLSEHAPDRLNARHVTVGIGACGDAKQDGAVRRLVDLMFSHSSDGKDDDGLNMGLKPDLIALNTAIHACAVSNAPDAALELLHEALPRANLTPDKF